MLFAPGIVCGGWHIRMKIAYTHRHRHCFFFFFLAHMHSNIAHTLKNRIQSNWIELNLNQICIPLNMINGIYQTHSVSLSSLCLLSLSPCSSFFFSLSRLTWSSSSFQWDALKKFHLELIGVRRFDRILIPNCEHVTLYFLLRYWKIRNLFLGRE